MGRQNSSFNHELNELITQYEAAIAENQTIYLDAEQLSGIADKYAADRKFSQAQEAITYGLRLHPNNTDLLMEQAYIYLDTRQIKKAKATLESITEEHDTYVKILKAEILLNEGQLDAAKECLQTICENELEVIIDIIYLYIDLGYPQEAAVWVEKGAVDYEKDEEYITALADYLYAVPKLEEAEVVFNKLIDKDPYNPSYWLGLAKCQYALEDFEKVIEACDFALAANEEYGEAYAFKGHCYLNINNCSEAIINYQKAITHKGIVPEAGYMFIGLTYSIEKEWKNAYEAYQTVLEICREKNDYDSPIVIDTYKNSAIAASEMNLFKEAHELCEKAKDVAPKDVSVYLTEGMIYLREDKKRLAKKAFEEALTHCADAEIYYQIGTYYSDLMMLKEAKSNYKKAYKLDPAHPNLVERMSIVWLLSGDVQSFFKYNLESQDPIDENFILKAISDIKEPESREYLKEIFNQMQEQLRERENEEEKEEKRERKNNNEKS